MSRWNFTARKSCRNRAGVSPQIAHLHRRAAQQNRLRERDVVAVEQALRSDVVERLDALFVLQVGEEAAVDLLGA